MLKYYYGGINMNLGKKNDPKVVKNLSSDHVYVDSSNNSAPAYKANTFDKKDSSSFHQQNVLYQSNVNLVPDYEKYRKSKVNMPTSEYTEEERLLRPVADKDAPLRIEKKDTVMPNFSKSANVDGMQFANANPVDEIFQNAQTTNEDIIYVQDEVIKQKKKSNWKKKIMPFIIAGVILEVLVAGFLSISRYLGKTSVLECYNESYNDFYKATVRNTKKYTFKNGKITKLLDTISYKFEDKNSYNEYKKNYAYPEYSFIKGRTVSFNINDNENIYEEKATYDYKELRKQNKSDDKHNISVSNDNDQLDLLDYNITDIKIIYEGDYTCR